MHQSQIMSSALFHLREPSSVRTSVSVRIQTRTLLSALEVAFRAGLCMMLPMISARYHASEARAPK